MSFLIGTAGHVDHGKTSLIKALTGTDTDRLPEEKLRGLTIDIGFASLDLEGVGTVSIVDVPGHERFIGNMLVGAGAMDIVILCVAADEGVKPQTLEHFEIIKLLPIQSMVVALTRCDLTDAASIEIVQSEIAELLSESRFEGSKVIQTSAIKQSGISELRAELATLAQEAKQRPPGRWYMPVDRTFSKQGFGTVVTGSLLQGSAKSGGVAELLPSGDKVTLKGLQSHDQSLDSAQPGTRVAMNLRGLEMREVERGMVVCEPGACLATNCFDAEVKTLKEVKHGQRVRISLGTDEVIGRVFLSDRSKDIVQFRTEWQTVAAKGQSLIFRNFSPPNLLGGGQVMTPQSERRRKNSVIETHESNQLVNVLSEVVHGLTTSQLARRLGTTEQAIAKDIEDARLADQILGFAGYWYKPSKFEADAQLFIEALKQEHQMNRSAAFIQKEKVALATGLPWADKTLDRIVAYLTSSGMIRSKGPGIAHADHAPQLKPRQRELLDRVLEELIDQKVNVGGSYELHLKMNIPQPAIKEITQVGLDAGELVHIAEGIVYPPITLAKIEQSIRKHLGGRRFTAAEFRTLFKTSRKYAIPLLEYYDSKGVTLRQGDSRVVKG